MKPVDLIRLALRDSGVNGQGQAPSDEDNNDAFLHLNMMLAQWNRKRWLVWRTRDVYTVANGNLSYFVGPGMEFNCPRPARVSAAFVRYIYTTGGVGMDDPIETQFVIGESLIGGENQGSDWPVTMLDTREDYNRIKVKNIVGGSYYAFYDADIPFGRIYFYPVPPAGTYELHIVVLEQLAQFPDLVTDIPLPDEYLEPLLFNLSKRLRFSYQMAADPALEKMARASLSTVRVANLRISQARMPYGVPQGRSRFNILQGNY